MSMTMTQKILAKHAGVDEVKEGDFIEAKLDMVLGNDVTTPSAIREFEKMSDSVFDKEKIAIVMDHFVPAKDIKTANQVKECRDFSRKHKIKHFYDIGKSGIEHVLLPEKGMVGAGNVIIGADSHTCTYGALGAFSTGVGSTDMAAGMATGMAWFRVPSAIKIILTGKPRKYIGGKDIILHIIGKIGVDGARYKSIEFFGDGIQHLTMADRFTISNMGIEAGAKNAIFPVDEKTREFMDEAGFKNPVEYVADEDAHYERTIEIDISKVEMTVAFPHLPENVKVISEASGVKVDQVVIGSCTNGSMKDLKEAAEIMEGRKIAPGVRLIVIPGTQKVFMESLENGIAKIFIEAGGVFSTPTCGPCLGGHMGILAKGEKCLSTTNRNFVGRMGEVSSEVYLASPAVAAASAINGYISSPYDIGVEE